MKTITTSEPLERRKNKRFPVQKAAFVFFNSKTAMMGRIVDIAVGGLGFTYLASKRHTGDVLSLDMLCVEPDYNMMDVPATTISDFDTTVDGERRCGVQFRPLTEDLRHDLKEFIECCNPGKA